MFSPPAGTPSRSSGALLRSGWNHTQLWVPPIVWAGLIFFFSSESDPLPALTAAVWDKILHALQYAGLAFLLCRAFRGERFTWQRSVGFALMLASMYAGTDEWHQLFVPERSADLLDWTADSVGASIGSALFWLLRVKFGF